MKDLGKAFSFIFDDSAWVSKLVVAALFMLLSIFVIGIFVLLGYFIELTQRVMRREPSPLPEWKDIGVKFVLGFKFFIVLLIYGLPVILLFVPLIVTAILASVPETPEAIGAFVAVYTVGYMFLTVPYILLFMLLTPIITYRFAMRESIGDALDVGAILSDFKRNWQNTLVVAMIGVGLESFAGIGILAFFVGIFFTLFYAYAVGGYMNGLLYLSTQEEGVTV